MIGRPPSPNDRSSPHQLELRARLSNALEGVAGWLHMDEAWTLHESARLAPSPSPVVVEIGSYVGRSAIALALGLKAAGGGRVFAIDPADMEPGQFESLMSNLEQAGVDDVVDAIRSTSHAARPRFDRSSVSVLFVDGSHEYEGVVEDISDWTTALADGAVAAFNDPFWPGVSKALRDKLGVRGTPFRRPRWVSQTVFFDFAPNERWTVRDAVLARRLRVFVSLGRRWRDFHWNIVPRRRVPDWAKQLQLRIAIALFKLILPTA